MGSTGFSGGSGVDHQDRVSVSCGVGVVGGGGVGVGWEMAVRTSNGDWELDNDLAYSYY